MTRVSYDPSRPARRGEEIYVYSKDWTLTTVRASATSAELRRAEEDAWLAHHRELAGAAPEPSAPKRLNADWRALIGNLIIVIFVILLLTSALYAGGIGAPLFVALLTAAPIGIVWLIPAKKGDDS